MYRTTAVVVAALVTLGLSTTVASAADDNQPRPAGKKVQLLCDTDNVLDSTETRASEHRGGEFHLTCTVVS